MGRRSMLLAVAGLVLLHAVPLRAQFRASIGALGVASRLNEKTLDGSNTFTGFVVGIEGTIVAGRFGVDLRYLEGNLSPDIADIQREIADAELLISYRPIRWLAIRTGPHLRALITEAGTQRFVLWEMRVQAQTTLFVPAVASYFELWRVLAGSVNPTEPWDGGQGLEGGLRIRIESLPVSGRFAYRVDRGQLRDGAHEETLEQLVFAIGWDFGR